MLTNIKIMQVALLLIFLFSCSQILTINNSKSLSPKNKNVVVKTGLDVFLENRIYKFYGRNIALVTNHSGLDMYGHSNVSRLLNNDSIKLVKIFTPEHGFTGMVPDGEHVNYNSIILEFPPIISLYGKSKKPTLEMLDNIDLIIYDIQDVGTRFYTYISTLGLVMETAGEANIPIIVLDRPNPIGDKVEGPVLDEDYKSFVGQYPIPIRYGMTIGELAKMIVGENMVDPVSELTVIPMENYNNDTFYEDTKLKWTKPSPNIVDLETAIVYPGLCLLQGTNVSNGRGTYTPIKRVGAPWVDSDQLIDRLENEDLPGVNFISSKFTPVSLPAMASSPKFQNTECFGIDINITDPYKFKSVLTGVTIISILNEMYPDSFSIINDSIDALWGSDMLSTQLKKGKTPQEIINSYQPAMEQFLQIRDKYLMYK